MGDISVWGWGGVGEWVGVSGWGGIRFAKETPLKYIWSTRKNNYHRFFFYKEILCKIVPIKFYKGISL